ncbi:hypothetical protein Q3G72_008350 [Acer saccharum]|nr:hypothetical protein Q3G72_008350 [Acer saccharum]
MAIHRACQLVTSNSLLLNRKLIIVSDSKVVVSWINSDHFGSLKHVELVYDIRHFLILLKGLEIKFLPRGPNSFADGLAKMGSNLSGDILE